ncbi:MAG: hypothetical protein IT480_18405 [Gammaproteobacteria bacterium]|nr:hypothetical protein [Gammaproteobacteria bacterium]
MYTHRTRKCRVASLAVAVALLTLGAPERAAARSTAEVETNRLLKGAIDMHFHMDPPTPSEVGTQADIAQVRIARQRGLRGVVLKDHDESTIPLAYHLRIEIPDLEIFGGVVMNLANGGLNPDLVDYIATQVKGRPGRVVWMPAGDGEAEVKGSRNPGRPFVAVVGPHGQLLPKVKQVVVRAAKYNLVLASGHINAEEALALFAEGKKAGVKHMIATHAMDISSVMTISQMKQAIALGAVIEIDFRNIFDEDSKRAKAIRELGPEHCLISEFWTRNNPRQYGYPEGVYAFITRMRQLGFTDRELDIMIKDNPAKLLDLPLL